MTSTWVYGSTFGTFSLSATSRLGATTCEASTWGSDSTVECRTAHGAMSTRRVTVTAGLGSVGSLTEAVSFDGPLLLSARFANRPATGRATVSVSGANLGALASYSVSARVGATACEASSWVSATAVACRAPAGVAASMRLLLTVGARAGTATDALSYDVPFLTRLARPNAPSVGGASVTVNGGNFGTDQYSVTGKIGVTAAEATLWASSSALVCRSNPRPNLV